MAPESTRRSRSADGQAQFANRRGGFAGGLTPQALVEIGFAHAPSRKVTPMNPLFHAARPILIDLAATLVFYGVLAVTGQVTVAVAVGIALGVVQLVMTRARGGKISALQAMSLALVVIMGGATLFTHDARFILIKPTIVYAAVGAAMLQRGWMARYMPPAAANRIPERYVVTAGRVWAGLMFVSAALNLALALTLDAASVARVMAIWSPASKIALFAGQYLLFRSVARRSARAAEGEAADAEARAAA
jgi:intracellular septation protein A